MIKKLDDIFVLNSGDTTYCFRVTETKQLEHLYYGKKITLDSAADANALIEKHAFAPGNTCVYDNGHNELSPEDTRLEMSAYGKGDIREPFIEVVHADGSFTSDFLYESGETDESSPALEALPCSYGGAEHLKITLRDKSYGLALELHYYVYDDCGVITRTARLINESESAVTLKRLMSAQVDFDRDGLIFTTFNGAWAREMQRTDTVVSAGKHVNSSYTGTSSNRANPFVMLSESDTSEDFGRCYGFNLVYSGNHYECCEVNGYGKTRFISGINPQSFSFYINAGESFEAPEAVMSFSADGFNGLSRNMHRFVREHIVRGEWKDKPRPILLNSWESCYFDINERKLLKLAKAAKDVGIELFVMDDGWFGERTDDTRSLGDWEPDAKKLPTGLKGLCDKIKDLGLEFGIWVEPEMVNVNSRLYEKHPDWALQIPGRHHSEGRNQRILDLTRADVREYVINEMSRVFSSADISYVKWDMNRIFTDHYSSALPPEKQGETAHRYVLGLYECMKTLTERFPKILFEGCASGGNRFDLGILCYFPQIWASDNTDALCRLDIQNGYSYGYPMSTVGAHVSSCPNHQTLRTTSLETRFNTACFGVLGYECNLCDMSGEELDAIKAQTALYKSWREVLQSGEFYRGRNGNLTEWICVSQDKKRAVGFIMQRLVTANSQYEYFKARGLRPDVKYRFSNRALKHNVKQFGDLVNTVAPIHIKQDSLVHDIVAKFVKMDGETEDYALYGDALMNCGVKLKQAFSGTGYNEQVRLFQDFASRIYFIEAEE